MVYVFAQFRSKFRCFCTNELILLVSARANSYPFSQFENFVNVFERFPDANEDSIRPMEKCDWFDSCVTFTFVNLLLDFSLKCDVEIFDLRREHRKKCDFAR